MPQPSPTSSRGSAGSATVVALRALLSVAVLIVLLAGLPLLLWWATAIVGPDGVRALQHLLSTQDTGQVFLLALAVVGWVGWAMFALSVLVEIPAQLRGRAAPQLSGLLGQRTAGALVGAIFLVLPAGTALASASTTAQAATPAATATAQPGTNAQASVTSKPAATHTDGQHTSVRYTVQQLRPAESLWSIAEQQLGDGNRWQEIADLNAGHTMTDGSTFQADAPIQPGWILHLPADARGPQKPPAPTQPRSYTVQPGDSLSQIAQHELGDADQWPQIYNLNKGQPQPGGHTLTDPDLIFPQEHLQLPGQPTRPGQPPTSDALPPEDHAPAASTPPATSAPATPAPSSSSPATSTPEQSPSSATRQTPSTSPSAAVPATPAPQTSSAPVAIPTAAPAATTTTADGTQTGSRMPLYAVGGGLLSAAVLTALGLRRRHQQRRRGIGRRIPLPTGTVAATEQALRATEQPEAPDFIDRALRTAAAHLAAAGRELPDLAAITYDPEGLELYLVDGGAPPVEPFTAHGGDLARWHCPATSTELLAPELTDAIEAPYPALVTLGSAVDGPTVLVDLEHYSMLVLTGPGRRHVLRALAVELATSRYAEHLDVAVAGADTCPGLSPLVPEWFTQYDDPSNAVRAADDHHTAQADALAALGVAGLRQARLRDDQASVWTPYLLLLDDTDDSTASALAELAGRCPRTAGAIVTAAGTTAPTSVPPGGWLLDTTVGQVRLPDTDLTVQLQVLPDDAYSDVIALLAESDASRPDVPVRPEPAPEYQPYPGATTSISAAPAAAPDLHAASRSVRVDLPQRQDDESDPGVGASLDSLMASFADLETDDADDGGTPGEPVPEPTTAVEPALVLPPAPRSPKPAAPSDPLIRVLGPVDITGASGTMDTKYVRTVTEIAAWMVLHPGLDHHAMDEAIWPGREVSRKTRNPWISRLRSLLGTAADGTKYLPAIATTDDARYRFADYVTSDWQLFQNLAAKGAASSGDHADDLLRAALDLVRGRPFSGVAPRRYVWAEHLAQDMIAAIVDVAAALGERRLALADPRGALWATTKGLDIAPEAEHLYRINFRAHHALGDHEGLGRAAGQLERLCDALGSDMEDATVELLRSLLASAAPLR